MTTALRRPGRSLPPEGRAFRDPRTGTWVAIGTPGASRRGSQWRFDSPAEGPGIDTSILRSDEPETVYGPQWTHPHPSFAPDGRSVVCTGDRDGWSQVYQVALPARGVPVTPAPAR